MDALPILDLELVAILVGAALLIGALVYVWRWDQRRRMRLAPVVRCGG